MTFTYIYISIYNEPVALCGKGALASFVAWSVNEVIQDGMQV